MHYSDCSTPCVFILLPDYLNRLNSQFAHDILRYVLGLLLAMELCEHETARSKLNGFERIRQRRADTRLVLASSWAQ